MTIAIPESGVHPARAMRIVAAFAVCLFLAHSSPNARAMGCHASDRPVLGLSHSWEPSVTADPNSQHIAPRIGPSPALTRRPCPGESPQIPKASFSVALPFQSPPIRLVSAEDPKPVASEDDFPVRPPACDRIERPPR